MKKSATNKLPSEADRHVGARIRTRRVLIGMSQERLGEAIGVTFQQVQKYEKGTNRVSAGRLNQMGSVLGVALPYFYEGLGIDGVPAAGFAEAPSAAYLAEPVYGRDGTELMRHFTRITDPKIRQKLIELVRAVVEADKGEPVGD